MIKTRLLYSDMGRRTYGLFIEKEKNLLDAVIGFSSDNDLSTSYFTAVGSLIGPVLSVTTRRGETRKKIRVPGKVEIIFLMGCVSYKKKRSTVSANVVVADSRGKVWGGRLESAEVEPKLEVIMKESPGYLRNQARPLTGLMSYLM